MNFSLNKKELTLISFIVLGAVGGGGVMALTETHVAPLPELGSAKEIVAEQVSKGDIIDVAEVTEVAKQSAEPEAPTGPVNINTAGEQELTRLIGIGPALAKRICEDRAAKGPYKSVDELQRVKGIGPATIEKNISLITIGK
jgi:comEA protein